MEVPLMTDPHRGVIPKTQIPLLIPSGNDGNGEVIPLKHTKKYFNHESHDGDSENDTPFTLPFP